MRIIYKTIFGSKLYGTNIETSDTDWKGVFIPDKRSIILGNVKDVISTSTNKESNTKDDEDLELYSLKEYLKQLKSGQTNAIDMLFARPYDDSMDPIWKELLNNKDKVLTNNSKSFIGYAYTQARKYSDKNRNYKVLEEVLDILNTIPEKEILKDHMSSFEHLIDGERVRYKNGNDGPNVKYFTIGHKSVQDTKCIKDIIPVFTNLKENYGERAKSPQDWKSIMHAIRIAQECKELLETGKITQPRPNADFLKNVRSGLYTYEDCCVIVESTVEQIDMLKSSLPDKPDEIWIEDFLYRTYLAEINAS